MTTFNKNFKKDFNYTWEHKKAILKVEKRLLGKITINGILHDLDKLFLYLLFDKKTVSKIHRKYAKHHIGNHKSKKDVINAIVDWESNRLTKADKQDTPREYLEKYIPNLTNVYKDTMQELGLW